MHIQLFKYSLIDLVKKYSQWRERERESEREKQRKREQWQTQKQRNGDRDLKRLFVPGTPCCTHLHW